MSILSNAASASAEETRAYIAAILELLGDREPMSVLRETPAALRSAVDGLSPARLTEREKPGKWSIRHVLQHLADSELVWGWRLRVVLAQDRPRLGGFDQDLWAERLGYDAADAVHALDDFSAFRVSNLRLLERVSPDDLERVGVHAERGEETVAHMMRLYAGHDLAHSRQLARIRRTIAANL